jgi:hypothetical protein
LSPATTSSFDTDALRPSQPYLEMAKAVCEGAPAFRDFLLKCESCGLPSKDRMDAHEAQVDFCTKFRQAFYPETL